MIEAFTVDNSGRRSDVDRRQFSYYIHIPERRLGKDRRGKADRRKKSSKNNGAAERRKNFKGMSK